jgi:hypothetical protein
VQHTINRSYEHIFYERRLGYKSILSRSGHAVAHDEERSAFERLGKRAGHTAQVAKFGDAPRNRAYGSRVSGVCPRRSGTGRECSVFQLGRCVMTFIILDARTAPHRHALYATALWACPLATCVRCTERRTGLT